MGAPPDVDFPEPTEEERELQREQLENLRFNQQILQEQARQQELLAPFLFESAGIRPIMDDRGRIAGFERVEPSEEDRLLQELNLDVLRRTREQFLEQEEDPLADRRRAVEEGLLARSEAALAGDLPVSPALEDELSEQERRLRAELLQTLGPDYETSTPGIEALDRFRRTSSTLREEARRGQLTLAEGLGLARGAANLQQEQQPLSALGFFGEFGRSGRAAEQGRRGTALQQIIAGTSAPLSGRIATAAGFNQGASGFNAPLSRLFGERQLQFQAGQRPDPLLQTLGLIAGQTSGAFLGGAGSSAGRKLFD